VVDESVRPQAPYGIGEGRLEGLEANGHECDQDGCGAGESKEPPFDRDLVGIIT